MGKIPAGDVTCPLTPPVLKHILFIVGKRCQTQTENLTGNVSGNLFHIFVAK